MECGQFADFFLYSFKFSTWDPEPGKLGEVRRTNLCANRSARQARFPNPCLKSAPVVPPDWQRNKSLNKANKRKTISHLQRRNFQVIEKAKKKKNSLHSPMISPVWKKLRPRLGGAPARNRSLSFGHGLVMEWPPFGSQRERNVYVG